MPSQLEILRRRAADLQVEIDAARSEGTTLLGAGNLTEVQLARVDTIHTEQTARRANLTAVEAQIREEEVAEARRVESETAQRNAGTLPATGGATDRRSGWSVGTEPLTYNRYARHSYYLDMARAARGQGDADGGASAARARLDRHAVELDVELPAREARRMLRAREQADRIPMGDEARGSMFERGGNMAEQRVAPNRTDGQGGYFVPPLWLVDEYIALARFGRQTANLCLNMDLPTGTDSINIPKISTGTKTGAQAADGAVVTSQDITDTFVNAPVRTIAGQQDVAMQLLDQSPVAFDQIIFSDLIADYNAQLDTQVINGPGTGGTHLGILNVASINSVTYTDASVTLPEMYPYFSQGASLIYKNRKLPGTAAIVHPSLWYWATSQLDTTSRPLIVPPQIAWNSMGTQGGLADESGPAGMLSMGLPAYIDGNMPTNLGAGANETRVIITRAMDLYLWEGALRSRVLFEVLSGTLQIRFQVYAYSAFMAGRRPESISALSGTGFIPQSGF